MCVASSVINAANLQSLEREISASRKVSGAVTRVISDVAGFRRKNWRTVWSGQRDDFFGRVILRQLKKINVFFAAKGQQRIFRGAESDSRRIRGPGKRTDIQSGIGGEPLGIDWQKIL